MSLGNCRKWYFLDPRFQHAFSWRWRSPITYIWSVFGTRDFLLACSTLSQSHATPVFWQVTVDGNIIFHQLETTIGFLLTGNSRRKCHLLSTGNDNWFFNNWTSKRIKCKCQYLRSSLFPIQIFQFASKTVCTVLQELTYNLFNLPKNWKNVTALLKYIPLSSMCSKF